MKKPWQTCEWKEKRDKLIEGKVCEWCGSQEGLSIHHKDQKIPYSVLFRIVGDRLLNDLVQKGVYTPLLKPACPRCHRFSLSARKTMQPKYRCPACGFTFDTPVPFSTGLLTEQDFKDFMVKYKVVIQEETWKISQAEYERYMNFEHVVILCKGCHFAAGKGLVICPRCKKNYCKPQSAKCAECTAITPLVVDQIRELSRYKETSPKDQAIIRDFLQTARKKAVDELNLKEGFALVHALKEIQIPAEMLCGKIVTMSKRLYNDGEMDSFFECAYCMDDHNQAHCVYDETGPDEEKE